MDTTDVEAYQYVVLYDLSAEDGIKRYAVTLIVKTSFGQQRWPLGTVESYRELHQVMHRAKGFERIARKTTYPKRWRFSVAEHPGHWHKGIETRRAAVVRLIGSHTDMDSREAARLASEASISKVAS